MNKVRFKKNGAGEGEMRKALRHEGQEERVGRAGEYTVGG